MAARCVRWTADTETAFLLALKATGRVTEAAAAIGRLPTVCHDRRRRNAPFRAAWNAMVATIEAERLAAAAAQADATPADAVPQARLHKGGWTQQRQRAFLRALADTGRYDEAARHVGLSYEAARQFRARSPAFQALCDTALIEGGAPTVREAATARAAQGWEEPVFQGGKLVGYRRRYSDTLARMLLAQEDVVAADRQARAKRTPPIEEIRADILKRVQAISRHNRAEEREVQLAWCERMEREGKAP